MSRPEIDVWEFSAASFYDFNGPDIPPPNDGYFSEWKENKELK